MLGCLLLNKIQSLVLRRICHKGWDSRLSDKQSFWSGESRNSCPEHREPQHSVSWNKAPLSLSSSTLSTHLSYIWWAQQLVTVPPEEVQMPRDQCTKEPAPNDQEQMMLLPWVQTPEYYTTTQMGIPAAFITSPILQFDICYKTTDYGASGWCGA